MKKVILSLFVLCMLLVCGHTYAGDFNAVMIGSSVENLTTSDRILTFGIPSGDGLLLDVLVSAESGHNLSETVTVTYDSALGVEYDVILDSAAIASDKYIYNPEGLIGLNQGDQITVSVTNLSATGAQADLTKAGNVYITTKLKNL